MASNRCHRPSLQRGQGFTAGKDDGGRLQLHNRPQILGRKITERAALPLTVIALGEIGIDRRERRASLAIEDELGGLLTTLKRARHHPDHGHGTAASRSPVRAACPLDGGVNCTGSRVEQADKALAEPFKHADALKPAQRDSERIDQLMDDAAKPEEAAQPEPPAEVDPRMGDVLYRSASDPEVPALSERVVCHWL